MGDSAASVKCRRIGREESCGSRERDGNNRRGLRNANWERLAKELAHNSMSSKHFFADSSALVIKSLRGVCNLNPRLSIDEEHQGEGCQDWHSNNQPQRALATVVYIHNPDETKVSLLCGGGSGHEPSHSGFVADGLLTGNTLSLRSGLSVLESE